MENVEKEKTPQEWEIGVLEGMAQVEDEEQLLDLAQDTVIRLASELACMKADIRSGIGYTKKDTDVLRMRIARVAVMMDVLQMRYGDCAGFEMIFLQSIETCLEEE